MRKNILLVDDEMVFNFLNEKTITNLGIAEKIYTALNGQEALDLFKKDVTLPDIILLDLNMPIMDGFEFLVALQNSGYLEMKKMLIIIVTSSANPSDIERIHSLGIKHYLNKPLLTSEIKSIVENEFAEVLN